jgi:hypothetical protein
MAHRAMQRHSQALSMGHFSHLVVTAIRNVKVSNLVPGSLPLLPGKLR